MHNQYDIVTELKGLEKSGEIKNYSKVTNSSSDIKETNFFPNDKLLNEVFNSISEGISILSKEFKILKVNHYINDLYQNKSPLIGKKCYQIYQGRNEICPWCPSIQSMETKKTCIKTVPYPNKKNPTKWLSLSSYPLMDDQEEVIGVIEYVKDITNEKKVEMELAKLKEKYEGLFHSNPEGILLLDHKGFATDINEAGLKLFGLQTEDVIGKHFLKFNIIRFRDITRYTKLFFDIIHGKEKGPVTIQFLNQQTKKPVYAEVYLTLLRSENKVTGLQVVSRDITLKKKSEELLIDSQQRYQNLFHNAADLIAVIDTKGRFIDLNSRFEQESGYKKIEMMGKNFFNSGVISKKSVIKLMPLFRKIISGKEIPITEIEGVTKEGHIIPYELRAVPIFKNKEIIGAQAILRNLSDRKKAEKIIMKEKIFSDSLLQSLPGIFYFFDQKGHFVRWNKNLEKITEYNANELCNINPIELFDIDEKQIVANRIKEVFEKGQSYVEANLLSKTGKKTPFYFTGIRVIFDEKLYLIGIGIDLTELKNTEIELHKAHDELIKINKNLEKTIEQRTTEIKRLLEQKDEFINQLGHDLKNPLGPFVYLLPVLKKHIVNKKDEEIVEVLERNAHYMQNLVKKTIELAKLNSSKNTFSFEYISFKDILEEVILTNKSFFEKNDIVVENQVSLPYMIYADPFHIQEVFTNLFNNAVKYSDGPGKITVDAKEIEQELLISVSDTGIGISKDQLDFLFDEYYKADSSRHDFDSSGLGLTICKRIVERHDGRIWAESKGIGQGSVFYISLPKNQKNVEINAE